MGIVDVRWPGWGGDAGLVVLTLVPPLLSQPYADPSGPAWVALTAYEAVAAVVLVLRRRLPATALVVGAGALVAALVAAAAQNAKLSPLAFLPLAVLLYNLGSRCPRWTRALMAAAGSAALFAAGIWVNRATAASPGLRGGVDVLAVLAPLPLAWAMGFAARTRQTLLAAAEQRAADASRARAMEAEHVARRERERIAREMHDVVAHSLTLLVMHAEILRSHGAELPGWARPQVDALAAAGRQSSGDLRGLLRMLRDPADATALLPTPGFGELDALLDSHRAAGGTVEVRKADTLESLPGPVQLAGYRVLQEALVNARRHAPGAPVRLTLDHGPTQLRCEVVNDRGTRRATAGAGVGHGLTGMRERVGALGGEFTAGPTGDGGFRVLVTMPLEVFGG
ncbi:histidine kinase [Streptomyces sp. NPDC047070]|uniref:sensor histidine kinase n=1 Tax=Streptomyces sp. NPDC047070 TaxID=3154923 RepID=UPI0034536729